MPSRETPTTTRGTLITDEFADEVAREAEAGYDLSTAKRVGRRPLAGSGGGRSPRLNFRVTADVFERTTQRAEREGKTISQVAREALEAHIERTTHST